MAEPKMRRDVARNRKALLAAARRLLAAEGPAVTFDDIAAAAGVSRTTLHRHFASRDELIAAAFADNVDEIERESARLTGEPNALVELFHFALDRQFEAPALSRVLSRTDVAGFSALASRTAAAFVPHFDDGVRAGVVHDEVTLRDVMILLPMAATALIEDDAAGRPRDTERVRALVHRAVFVTPVPGAAA